MLIYFTDSVLTMFVVGLAICFAVIFGGLHLANQIRRRLIWRPPSPEPNGDKSDKRFFSATVFDLIRDERYTVIEDFTDYYNAKFQRGEILTYRNFDFLPYHNGYTLNFVERTIYLQGEENAEFLQNVNAYLQRAPQD